MLELAPCENRLLPHLLRMLPTGRSFVRAWVRRPTRSVVVEGLDVALVLAVVSPWWRHRAFVHVDVCDSRVRLASAPGWGPRRAARMVANRVALGVVGAWADSVSYISQRDLAADRSLLTRAEPLVVGVGADREHENVWSPDGPFVVVGDWSYEPNRRMLRATLAWFGDSSVLGSVGLRVVGPHLDLAVDQAGVDSTGWVDDLTDGLRGAVCALALIDSGAGVKNKVLEALLRGIPVVGSPEALNGIASSELVLSAAGDVTPQAAWEWARAAGRSTARLRLPTWADVTAPLAGRLIAEASSS